MADSIKATLLGREIPAKQIHTEHFVNATHIPGDTAAGGSGGKRVIVHLKGKRTELPVPEGATILDVLVKAKMDPPYSCTAGACSTCMAKLIDGKVKIGPTAIPITGREQYSLTEGWSGSDIAQALKGMKSLITGNSHDLRTILKSEWPKIIQKLLVKESTELVPSAIGVRDWHRKPPGIRAQLVHLPTGKLEQDFIVTSQANATHVLNAVSPGWTSALPFGRWIANRVLSDLEGI
jgi:ferredoxin